jgi:hypothetical protein
MLRLAQVGVIALLAVAGVNADQRKVDCAEAYLAFMHELMLMEMPTERRIALHRWALRAYNACDTGDLHDPKGLFERLRRERAGRVDFDRRSPGVDCEARGLQCMTLA